MFGLMYLVMSASMVACGFWPWWLMPVPVAAGFFADWLCGEDDE
jgi:hypothetical protein